MQETLLLATVTLGRLRQPELLRAWLYAAARRDCYRRLCSGQAAPPARPPADLTAGVGPGLRAASARPRGSGRPADRPARRGRAEPGARAERQRAGRLLRGVPRRARTLRSRAAASWNGPWARSSSPAATQRGRGACPALAALLARPDRPLGAAERHRISRHADQCAACAGVRRRELSPALQAGVPPLTALAPWFRQHVLSACADATPADRAAAAARAGRFGSAACLGRPGRRPGPVGARSSDGRPWSTHRHRGRAPPRSPRSRGRDQHAVPRLRRALGPGLRDPRQRRAPGWWPTDAAPRRRTPRRGAGPRPEPVPPRSSARPSPPGPSPSAPAGRIAGRRLVRVHPARRPGDTERFPAPARAGRRRTATGSGRSPSPPAAGRSATPSPARPT